MNRNKIIALISVTVLVLSSLLGVYFLNKEKTKSLEEFFAELPTEWRENGIDNRNTSNVGWCSQNGNVFAASQPGVGTNIYILTNEGVEKVHVYDGLAWDLNVTKDKLYFGHLTDGQRIYSVNHDGTDLKPLNDTTSMNIIVNNDWIYFIDNEDGNKVYRMDKNGGNTELVMEHRAVWINIQDNIIYYADDQDELKLKSFNLITKENKKLTQTATARPTPYGEWVYYIEDETQGNICRVHKQSGKKETLLEGTFDLFTINNDCLYYYKPEGTFEFNLTTGKESRLLEKPAFNILTAEEYVLFFMADCSVYQYSNGKLFKLELADKEG
jgi:hypothetical protein